MDKLLHTTKGPSPNTVVLWRPQEGSSVVLEESDYRPFSNIVRTVHLPDALDVCAKHGIAPKPILTLSTLNAKVLSSVRNHPCGDLHVIWFGTKLDWKDEDAHDWYGNVEFAIPTDVIMQQWKNLYLVEMVSANTHTATRILVTNSDYSSVLPQYDPRTGGGPWRLTPDGRHECLADCRRYNSRGYNRHGHTLEFMIEVTPFGMRKILEESTISFRNHELGRSGGPHDCHRYKRSAECPTPFTRDFTSMVFFKEHHRLNALQPMATLRLSPSAETFRQHFLAGEKIPRDALQVSPRLSDEDFPPPNQGCVIFQRILKQHLPDGRLKKCQLLFGFDNEKSFRITKISLMDPSMREEEEEEEQKVVQFKEPRQPPGMFAPVMSRIPPRGLAPPMGPLPLPQPPGSPPMDHPPLPPQMDQRRLPQPMGHQPLPPPMGHPPFPPSMNRPPHPPPRGRPPLPPPMGHPPFPPSMNRPPHPPPIGRPPLPPPMAHLPLPPPMGHPPLPSSMGQPPVHPPMGRPPLPPPMALVPRPPRFGFAPSPPPMGSRPLPPPMRPPPLRIPKGPPSAHLPPRVRHPAMFQHDRPLRARS